MQHSDHTGSREHSHAPTTMQHNPAMHAKAIKCYAKVTIPLHGYGMRVPAPVTDEKNGTTGTPPSMVLASTPDYISHRWRRQLPFLLAAGLRYAFWLPCHAVRSVSRAVLMEDGGNNSKWGGSIGQNEGHRC